MIRAAVAAIFLAALPVEKVERPEATFEGVCLSPSGAKVAGQVILFSPTHALVKDEEGNILELWGSFMCFRVDPAPAPRTSI